MAFLGYKCGGGAEPPRPSLLRLLAACFFAFSAVISYTHVFARATRFDKIFFGVLGAPCLLSAVGIIYLLLREDSPFRNERATARVTDLPPADVC